MDNNQKILDTFIETLTQTMNEAVMQTVHLKTNAKISDEVIRDQQKQFKELEATHFTLMKAKDELQGELARLNAQKAEFENTKHQVSHLDTFRNELIAARQELEIVKENFQKLVNVNLELGNENLILKTINAAMDVELETFQKQEEARKLLEEPVPDAVVASNKNKSITASGKVIKTKPPKEVNDF